MPATSDIHVQSESGGLWLTISQIAERRGVRKSTISQRVAELEAVGLIKPKPGKGRAKLVHYASFLAAIGASGDAAKEAVALTRAAQETDELVADPTFRQAQTREKQLAADLKELELKQRLGELVPVADLAEIASQAAERAVAAIDRLPNNADDMAAAVGHDGGAPVQARRPRPTQCAYRRAPPSADRLTTHRRAGPRAHRR